MAAPFASPTPDLAAPSTWEGDRLEVRFSSDEALQRGMELVRSQSWVSECEVDPATRSVTLRMAGVAPAATVTAPSAPERSQLH